MPSPRYAAVKACSPTPRACTVNTARAEESSVVEATVVDPTRSATEPLAPGVTPTVTVMPSPSVTDDGAPRIAVSLARTSLRPSYAAVSSANAASYSSCEFD